VTSELTPLPRPIHSGKVRDLYDAGDGRLIMVASDRMSAFDVILPTPIPDKGKILTALSLWWFEQLADLIDSHLISADVADYPAPFTGRADLAGRSMLIRRLDMVMVECVARAYLSGSGTTQYRATGTVSGVALPPGLVEGSKLPEPIFTPTTKALPGDHDEPITYADVVDIIGAERAAEVSRLTVDIMARGQEICEPRGVILADTKVEFGTDTSGAFILADEVLTPDSSRFWPVETWSPGQAQVSFDKQPLRDWLASTGWDKKAPGPELPADVVAATRARYVSAYEQITGRAWTGS
jgi:phosphoribosylaminoimidazole-succinocarboxamide synthase